MNRRTVSIYYAEHENPHHITYTTFLHRVWNHWDFERAMSTPYFGKGGDRRSVMFVKREYILPTEVAVMLFCE